MVRWDAPHISSSSGNKAGRAVAERARQLFIDAHARVCDGSGSGGGVSGATTAAASGGGGLRRRWPQAAAASGGGGSALIAGYGLKFFLIIYTRCAADDNGKN